MTPHSEFHKTSKGAVVNFTEQGSVDDQAAKWVARLDFDEPSQETLVAFRQWINQSPQHREAFESYVAVWERMNALSQLVPPRELESRRRASNEEHSKRHFSIWGRYSWSAIGTILVVAVVIVARSFTDPSAQIYSTAIGEQESVTLSDGSTVLLNTNSNIEVRYSDQRRVIRLTQGEAHFDVAKNPSLPFEVYAGQGLVRAVGTAFSVHLRKDDVEVVVTEGVVEIDEVSESIGERTSAKLQKTKSSVGDQSAPPVNAQRDAPSQIRAGNLATYDRYTAKHVLLAEIKKLDEKLSWHQGMLVFEDEPLENVVAEVGRYTSTKILIPEHDVRQLKIGGQFRVGDTQAMFEALKISFNIQAEVVSDDLVYLVFSNDQ
jgi:transmembrane sensor